MIQKFNKKINKTEKTKSFVYFVCYVTYLVDPNAGVTTCWCENGRVRRLICTVRRIDFNITRILTGV